MLYKGQFAPGHTAHQNGTGVLVSGEAGVSYIVTDVITAANTIISTDAAGAGDIIMRASAGHSNLTSPIKVAEGSGIFQSTSTSTTIVYHKDQ